MHAMKILRKMKEITICQTSETFSLGGVHIQCNILENLACYVFSKRDDIYKN